MKATWFHLQRSRIAHSRGSHGTRFVPWAFSGTNPRHKPRAVATSGPLRFLLLAAVLLHFAPLQGRAQETLTSTQLNLSFSYQLPTPPTPESVPDPKFFTLNTASSNPVSFTAEVQIDNPDDITWLSATPASGSTPQLMTVSVNPAGLAPFTYRGRIVITAAGASNSPFTIEVTFDIAGDRELRVSENVLDLQAAQGGAAASQNITLFTIGTHLGALRFDTSTATQSGGDWLSVSPSEGTAPQGLTISANPAGLSQGAFIGAVTIADTSVRTVLVQVRLTVAASPPQLSVAPAALLFIAAPGQNPASQPLQVQNAGGGQLGWTAETATSSGGNWLSVNPTTGTAPSSPQVAVNSASLAAGAYNGSVTVTVLPASGGGSVSVPVGLAVGVPAVGIGGVVSGASFSTEAVVAPSSIASLFGVNLATDTASATELPLPTTLAGTQVLVNEVPAPLFFVSPTQINLQMPGEVAGTAVTVVVVAGGVRGLEGSASIAPEVPGIFTLNQQGTGQGAVLLANTEVFAAPVGSVPGRSSRPANRGEFLSIFCTGLGATSPPVPPGEAAGSSPLSETLQTPVVTIGGVPAEVSFSGLAPGFVGLYQINVPVPQGAPTGDAVPLVIQIGGRSSNTATVAIQ